VVLFDVPGEERWSSTTRMEAPMGSLNIIRMEEWVWRVERLVGEEASSALKGIDTAFVYITADRRRAVHIREKWDLYKQALSYAVLPSPQYMNSSLY